MRFFTPILGFLYFVMSCNTFTEKENKTEPDDPEANSSSVPIHYKSRNKNYYRDSLFVATTVWQFIDKKVDIFDYYKDSNIPLNEVKVDVDTIIYSPDKLKLFAFVIQSHPESEDYKKPKETIYLGTDMIGFRTNLKEPWTMYFFGAYRPTGFKKYNTIRNIFREYYLGNGEFKDDSRYYWDGIGYDSLNNILGKNRISIKFGYNIDNVHFWDSSIVWKKGSRIPMYYSFQTNDNVVPGDENAIVVIPHLDYPDSLLQLYK